VSAAKIRLVAIGLKAQDLANAAGIHKQALSRWLGAPETLNVKTLRKLAALLHCPAEALLDRTGRAPLDYPAPPPDFLASIEANRAAFGKGGDFSKFEIHQG
jgi:transcriptional regulator with XRE-family HTH domain